MHYCRNCNIRFDKPRTYINHRRKEHSKLSCPDCGKYFRAKKKLVYHLKGCRETRRNKERHETTTGSIISLSNKKILPIVTAKELDTEFEIYMNRKFAKNGIFRNEKMCKFCCQTFVMASDFADHIREHYKSIPLDASGVKSKFDFMHFMGLKIRETNYTDCSDTEALDKLKNKMAECRVVIIGERCKICYESFKCRTDLDKHNKIQHSVKNRNTITVILRIGREIISRIPLRKRHIQRGRGSMRTGHRPSLKYPSNVGTKHGETDAGRSVRQSTLKNEINSVSQNLKLVEKENNAQSVMSSEKERRRKFCLQNGINRTKGNMTRRSEEERGTKEIVMQEKLNAVDESQNDSGLEESGYELKMRSFELESGRIFADEFFESMQFSEPWKDEFAKGNGSWCSEIKSERNDLASDEESCYCMGTMEPRLTPKNRNPWEEEHYNNILNGEEGGSYHGISFHESPPIYKYSCDSKYQADFSFPSDEKSYGFQVNHEGNEETNNNEKDDNKNINEPCPFGYKGPLILKNEGTNLTVNHSLSDNYQCEEKPFGFQDLENSKTAANDIDEYQKVLIKEEVMLEDCTCCINDVHLSFSHLSA